MEYRIVYSHNPNRKEEYKKTLAKAQKRAEKVNEPAAIFNMSKDFMVCMYFGPDYGWNYVH